MFIQMHADIGNLIRICPENQTILTMEDMKDPLSDVRLKALLTNETLHKTINKCFFGIMVSSKLRLTFFPKEEAPPFNHTMPVAGIQYEINKIFRFDAYLWSMEKLDNILY